MAHIAVEGTDIVVRSRFEEKDLCKSVLGATWDRTRRVWTYPLSLHTAKALRQAFGDQALDDSVRALLEPTSAKPIDLPAMNLTLWQHQQDAVRKLAPFPGGMLAFDMRCGKTGTALTLCELWAAQRVLVICPLSVISVWPAEFALHSPRRWAVAPLEDGSVAKRTEQAQRAMNLATARGEPFAAIVNYDAIIREPLLEWLCGQDWDVMVLDEIHHCKAASGKQSRAAQRISRRAKHRLGLTGTPMPHSPLDIYAQYRALDASIFGTSYVQFRSRYCNTPDAPIWMADQTFKPIGEVIVGDLVMGWNPPKSPARHRTLEVSTVEAVGRRVADNVIRVTMESGAVIKCTSDHRWLSAWHKEDGDTNWVEIKRDCGRGKPSIIARVVVPPRKLSDAELLEAAWLGGIYDGEGSGKQISQSRSHNPDICIRIESVLNMLGIEWVYRPQRGRGGSYDICGGLQTYVNLLNWLPITKRHQLCRLILKSTYSRFVRNDDRAARMHKQPDRVVKIEALSPQEVVSLQTSTGNYFAWGYASKNCIMGGYGGYEVKGFQNQDELQEKFYSIAYRVMKRDVLDLPPVMTEDRYCTLDTKERRVYDQLEKEFYVWLDTGGAEVTVTNALVKLLRLQQVASGFVLDDSRELVRVGRSKLKAYAEWLEDIPANEPMVTFCRFTEDVEQTAYECRKAGRSVGLLCGGTNDLQAFKGGDVDTLICQIQAGAEGINLTRASLCAFFSVGFSLGQYEQALARCDGPGQTQSVTNIRFIARQTVDERCYQALAAKSDVVRMILAK